MNYGPSPKSRQPDSGASMVEYALMAALVAVVAIGAITLLGQRTSTDFDSASTGFGTASESPTTGGTGGGGGGTAPGSGSDSGSGSGSGGGSGSGSGSGSGDAGSATTTTVPTSGTVSVTTVPQTSTVPVTTVTTTVSGGGSGGGTVPTTTPVEKPPAAPGSEASADGGASTFYWWNNTPSGGNGAWVGTVKLGNDWIRHQYLTMTVTATTADGKTSTRTIDNFYVPAGGSANLQLWDNNLEVDKTGTPTAKSVVGIDVTVTKIVTSDKDWKTMSFATSGPTVSVEAPAPK